MVITTSLEMFWPNCRDIETFQRVITLEALFQTVMLGIDFKCTLVFTLTFMLFNSCITYPAMHEDFKQANIFLLMPADIVISLTIVTLVFMAISSICVTLDSDAIQTDTYLNLLNRVESGVILFATDKSDNHLGEIKFANLASINLIKET